MIDLGGRKSKVFPSSFSFMNVFPSCFEYIIGGF
jgi:hypothetical protein